MPLAFLWTNTSISADIPGQRLVSLPGMEAFVKAFHPHRLILVGGDGISVESFLSMDPQQWIAG